MRQLHEHCSSKYAIYNHTLSNNGQFMSYSFLLVYFIEKIKQHSSTLISQLVWIKTMTDYMKEIYIQLGS